MKNDKLITILLAITIFLGFTTADCIDEVFTLGTTATIVVCIPLMLIFSIIVLTIYWAKSKSTIHERISMMLTLSIIGFIPFILACILLSSNSWIIKQAIMHDHISMPGAEYGIAPIIIFGGILMYTMINVLVKNIKEKR